MFAGLGWPELGVILVLALFVFGPERLPGLAQDAGRALRRIRVYLQGIRDDLASKGVWLREDQGLAVVAALAQPLVDRDLAEQRDLGAERPGQRGGHRRTSSRAEDVDRLATVRAREIAHVLDHTGDSLVRL